MFNMGIKKINSNKKLVDKNIIQKECSVKTVQELLQTHMAYAMVEALSNHFSDPITDRFKQLGDESQYIYPNVTRRLLALCQLDITKNIVKNYVDVNPSLFENIIVEQKIHPLFQDGEYIGLKNIEDYIRQRGNL